MPPFNVEWESSIIRHGPRRGKLKSSTIHGWIVKWRGTFSGNETSRARGIREMRQASADRSERGGFFGQLFKRNKAKKSSGRPSASRRSSGRPSASRRTTAESGRSRGSRQNSNHRPSAARRRSTR